MLADGAHTYLYGNGRIAQHDGSGLEYFLGDALGSVRQLADASADVTLTRSFEPYGEVLTSTGTGTTVFAFTGEQFDSYIKLLFLRARWLNPATGRFLSKDTWRDYSRPLSLNGWSYIDGDPINYTDPSGHQAEALGNYPVHSYDDIPDDTCRYSLLLYDPSTGTWIDFCLIYGPGESPPGQDQIASRQCASTREKSCPPCPPRKIEVDRVPPSRKHGACPGDHWHWYGYHQNQETCECFGPYRYFGGCLKQGEDPPDDWEDIIRKRKPRR